MKVVLPAAITGSNLVDTNVTETQAIWDSATTYAIGDEVRVIQSDGSSLAYEALVETTGEIPADTPASWLETGPTNLWAMFDGKYGTRTEQEGSIDVTIAFTGRVPALALLNLSGTSVDVVVTDANDVEVYNETFPLVSTDGINNWYDWFFGEIESSDSLFVSDLPNVYNPTIRVTVHFEEGTAAVGWFIAGTLYEIGKTERDLKLGLIDYSVKETDDFGNFRVVERPFSRTVTAKVWIEKARVDPVYKLLSDYRATPLLWIPTEAYGSSIIPGFYRDFDIAISYPTLSICNIEIEGLT